MYKINGRAPFQEPEIGKVKLYLEENGEILIKDPCPLSEEYHLDLHLSSDSDSEPDAQKEESDQDLPIKPKFESNILKLKLNESDRQNESYKSLDLHLSFSDDESEIHEVNKSNQSTLPTKKRVRFTFYEDYGVDPSIKKEFSKYSYSSYQEKIKYENSKKAKKLEKEKFTQR